MSVKDFQDDCEWKWIVNKQNERLHVKENSDGHKKYKKVSENNRQSNCEYKINAMK